MGCGSSAPSDVIEAQSRTNGRATAVRPHRAPTSIRVNPDQDDDIPTEVLPDSRAVPVKPPLAFEINFDSDKDAEDGLVRKHPPRPPLRLQRLHAPEQTPTLEELQEKLESAERRRLQILQSRIASASKASRHAANMLHDHHMGDRENPPESNMDEMKSEKVI